MLWILGLWSGFKSNRSAQIIALITFLAAATFVLDQCAQKRRQANVEKGRTEQRADHLEETIRQVERANNASEVIRVSPAARRSECLRDSRTPENC